MPPYFRAAAIAIGLLFGSAAGAAETLRDALGAAGVAAQGLPERELNRAITSYAVSQGDPFLIAYYDGGSGFLQAPLRVVRAQRATGAVQMAELAGPEAQFGETTRAGCLGSALRIREQGSAIYIETHLTPSAGCVIVLSTELKLRNALSGWLVGMMAPDLAIVRKSEIHFAPIHAVRLEAYDAARDRATLLFPPPQAPLRAEISAALKRYLSEPWCMSHNSPCDPGYFNTDLRGEVAVNAEARTFGFETISDANGFGDEAERRIQPQTLAYIFRERAGAWESRELDPRELTRRFGVSSIGELVQRAPGAAFRSGAGK